MTGSFPTALITGAATGIGATYAERLARRGHDLVLVARDQPCMKALATRLRAQTGIAVDIVKADLADKADLACVEARLRDDDSIGILVNNAGATAHGSFGQPDAAAMDWLIRLNVVSLTRLSSAAVPRFLRQGKGAIVNISSVAALAPELPFRVYSATKAFVLTLSQSLQAAFGPHGLYVQAVLVQAVLPDIPRADIWERSGRDANALTGVEVGELVDAALAGFDRREPVTIPPLPDAGLCETFNSVRQAMLPNFAQEHAAERSKAA